MITVRMFGSFSISVDNSPPLSFPTQKAVGLLAYLIGNSQKAFLREYLADLFWPEHPPEKARRSLLTALWQIRSTLKKAGLDSDQYLHSTHSISWDSGDDFWLDIQAFEQAATLNTPEDLRRAVGLYRGPFLQGIFEDWVIDERYRLEVLYAKTLSRLIKLALLNNQLDESVNNANLLLATDPLDEDAHRALMLCYYRQGNRTAAIEQYEKCARLLKKELDIQPSEETHSLYNNILAEKLAYAKADLVKKLPLGKNLPTTHPHGSRSLLTGEAVFVNRQDEMEQLVGWWKSPSTICAYISGEPGTGKTRLAQEFVNQIKTPEVLTGWGHLMPVEQEIPYQGFLSCLRTLLLSIPEEVRNHFPIWIKKVVAHLIPQMAEDRYLTGIPPKVKLDQEQLFDFVSRLLHFIARHNPILLILDGIQWLSRPATQLIEYLVRFFEEDQNQSPHAIRFLFTGPCGHDLPGYIEQAFIRLHRAHLILEMTLQNLDQSSVIEWIKRWSQNAPNSDALAGCIYEQTNGNPFLVQEIVRDLFSSGQLTSNASIWGGEILENPCAKIAIPASIQLTVLGAVTDLSPLAREVLNAAAVLGKTFNLRILQKVLVIDETDILKAAEEIIRIKIFQKQKTADPYDFEFPCELTARIIYNEISEPRRAILHHRTAQVFEDEMGENAVALILYHYHNANEILKAIDWSLKAGQLAKKRSDFNQAIQYFLQAESFSKQFQISQETLLQIYSHLSELFLLVGDAEKGGFYSGLLKNAAQKDGQQEWLEKANYWLAMVTTGFPPGSAGLISSLGQPGSFGQPGSLGLSNSLGLPGSFGLPGNPKLPGD